MNEAQHFIRWLSHLSAIIKEQFKSTEQLIKIRKGEIEGLKKQLKDAEEELARHNNNLKLLKEGWEEN